MAGFVKDFAMAKLGQPEFLLRRFVGDKVIDDAKAAQQNVQENQTDRQSDAGATTDASLAEKDSKRRKRSGRSALTYGTGGGVPKKGLLKTSTKSSKLGG